MAQDFRIRTSQDSESDCLRPPPHHDIHLQPGDHGPYLAIGHETQGGSEELDEPELDALIETVFELFARGRRGRSMDIDVMVGGNSGDEQEGVHAR